MDTTPKKRIRVEADPKTQRRVSRAVEEIKQSHELEKRCYEANSCSIFPYGSMGPLSKRIKEDDPRVAVGVRSKSIHKEPSVVSVSRHSSSSKSREKEKEQERESVSSSRTILIREPSVVSSTRHSSSRRSHEREPSVVSSTRHSSSRRSHEREPSVVSSTKHSSSHRSHEREPSVVSSARHSSSHRSHEREPSVVSSTKHSAIRSASSISSEVKRVSFQRDDIEPISDPSIKVVHVDIPTETTIKKKKRASTSDWMDVLQNKERIEKLLQNYIRIESMDDVPMYSHVRYITLDNSQRQSFRIGGVFVRNYPDHVRLGNGRYMWNVPKYHYPRDKHGNPDYTKQPLFQTVFYRQLTKMDRCIVKLQKQQEIIERLKHLIRSKENGSISRLLRENDAITYDEDEPT